MGNGFACIAFALSIWRDDEQWHFTLLGCGPAVMPITVDAMIACNEDRVTAFLPFCKNGAEENILFDRLPAILL